MTDLPPLPDCAIVLCKPDFGLPTPELFARLDGADLGPRPDTAAMAAALARGDLAAAAACLGNVFERVLTEIPAGKRETGEEPFLTAQRELKEEIGAEAGRWTELGALIASPGCYGETLYLYMAEDLTFGETHPDEDEFLEVLRVPFEEAVRQCMDGTLTDAKTVAAVLKGRLLREGACTPAADTIH